jgi:hypothetical protein
MTLEMLIAGWKERRSMLVGQLGMLRTSYPPHDDVVRELKEEDIGRVKDWIVVLDKLIAEHSR